MVQESYRYLAYRSRLTRKSYHWQWQPKVHLCKLCTYVIMTTCHVMAKNNGSGCWPISVVLRYVRLNARTVEHSGVARILRQGTRRACSRIRQKSEKFSHKYNNVIAGYTTTVDLWLERVNNTKCWYFREWALYGIKPVPTISHQCVSTGGLR